MSATAPPTPAATQCGGLSRSAPKATQGDIQGGQAKAQVSAKVTKATKATV